MSGLKFPCSDRRSPLAAPLSEPRDVPGAHSTHCDASRRPVSRPYAGIIPLPQAYSPSIVAF